MNEPAMPQGHSHEATEASLLLLNEDIPRNIVAHFALVFLNEKTATEIIGGCWLKTQN